VGGAVLRGIGQPTKAALAFVRIMGGRPTEPTTVPMTTDEDALLAAITAAPDDDAPRLVYADWLEERGADAKAEYLRAVVKLMHPPEDPEVVTRCLALAPELDAHWRQRVGGRFEVLVQGSGPLLIFTHIIRSLIHLANWEPMDLWQTGRPVPVRRDLTRENAEQIARAFGLDLAKRSGRDEPILKMTVRPMGEDSPPSRPALPPR
jgi:uncharacterized protein (TIGR02996 family)